MSPGSAQELKKHPTLFATPARPHSFAHCCDKQIAIPNQVAPASGCSAIHWSTHALFSQPTTHVSVALQPASLPHSSPCVVQALFMHVLQVVEPTSVLSLVASSPGQLDPRVPHNPAEPFQVAKQPTGSAFATHAHHALQSAQPVQSSPRMHFPPATGPSKPPSCAAPPVPDFKSSSDEPRLQLPMATSDEARNPSSRTQRVRPIRCDSSTSSARASYAPRPSSSSRSAAMRFAKKSETARTRGTSLRSLCVKIQSGAASSSIGAPRRTKLGS